jgi:hypothetical protein
MLRRDFSAPRPILSTMQTKLDTLGRRPRHIRTPSGKSLHLTDRDLLLLSKLHRHGPLPSPYLRAFSKLLRNDERCATRRLADLYHETQTPHNGAYLDRPAQQFNTIDPRSNHIVYDLTARGQQALKDARAWSQYAPKIAGSWVHRLMTACITASIEIETLRRSDVRFIAQEEILSRAGAALRFDVPFTDPVSGNTMSKPLIPDALFGLQYNKPSGTYYRFFFVEADRNTEANRSGSFERKSYLRTILQYRELIGRGLYKEPLQLTAGAMVLNVTTGHEHMRKLVELTGELSEGRGNNYMLYAAIPDFATPFKPPDILTDLFAAPWSRAGDPFRINTVNGTL